VAHAVPELGTFTTYFTSLRHYANLLVSSDTKSEFIADARALSQTVYPKFVWKAYLVDARVKSTRKEFGTVLKRYFKFVALCAILVLPIFLSACQGTSAAGNDDVAAVVNGKEIKMEEVDHAIERQLKASGQTMSQLTPVDQASARLQALNSLVQQEVLYQKAQNDKVNVTEGDVDQAFAQQKQSTNLSEEDWQKQLKDIGMSEQELREQLRKTLAINKLNQQVAAKVKNPSDREISDYFDQNPEQFKLGRAVELSTIIVNPSLNVRGRAAGEEGAKAKINLLYSQLKSGSDFATIARTQSEDESAAKGGDQGWVSEDNLKANFSDELAAKLFSMTEGQYTEPIKTKGVWIIIKLTAKRTQEQKLTKDDANVRQQISQGLLNQRQQVLLGALETEAMSSARIENYLAKRIVDNPDTFGAMRQSNVPSKPADQKPADQKPAAKQ